MIADFYLCPRCKKIVVHKDNKCPNCGILLRAIDQGEAFLTGPCQPRREIVNLGKGVSLIDRFQIKELLGKGRFGAIYLAQDLLRSDDVALKVVGLGSCEKDLSALHLQREMQTNKIIMDYSHVIQVYDFHLVPWEGSVLLLQSMEYANGGTFRKWLAEYKEDIETRRKSGLKFFKQICYGVCSIHQAGAFLLDLKPDNLLFCENVLKVSDFGTAKFAETIGSKSTHLTDIRLHDSGTPIYMSPEQFIAPHIDDIDLRSDIYSLGIILYELLHPKCHPPFNGSYRRLRELHLEVQAPRLPETNEKLRRIVARCLKKDPVKRYQTADELIEALEGKSPKEIEPRNLVDIKSKQTTNSLEKTWEEASNCYTKGKFKNAAALADDILKMQPDNGRALSLKEKLNDRFLTAERFYQEISGTSEGDLSDLIELLEEAISIYPDHPSGQLVQTKLAARARQYRKAMEEGLSAFQKEYWLTALSWYRKAFELHCGTQNLNQIIEFLTQIENTRQKINVVVQQGNFDAAIGLARTVDIYVDEMKDRMPAFRQSRMYDEI
jgi:serine/threonine protein kinase